MCACYRTSDTNILWTSTHVFRSNTPLCCSTPSCAPSPGLLLCLPVPPPCPIAVLLPASPLQGFLSPHGFLEGALPPPPPPSTLVRRQASGKAQSYPGSGGGHMFGITATTTSGQDRAPPQQHDEVSREGGPGRHFGSGGADAGWQRGRRPALLQPLQPLQLQTGMGHQPGAANRLACYSWEGGADDAGGRRRPDLGAPADLLRSRHAAEPVPLHGTGMPLQPPPPPPLGQRSAGAFWGPPHQMQSYYPPVLSPPPPPPPRRLLQTLSAPAARTPFMLLQAARRDASTAASRLSSFHGAASSPLSPPFHLQYGHYGAHPPAVGSGGEDRHVIRGTQFHQLRWAACSLCMVIPYCVL